MKIAGSYLIECVGCPLADLLSLAREIDATTEEVSQKISGFLLFSFNLFIGRFGAMH